MKTLPAERALGIQWCIETDTFKFIISSKDRLCTRRGILSEVNFRSFGICSPSSSGRESNPPRVMSPECRLGRSSTRRTAGPLVKVEIGTRGARELCNPLDFGQVVKAELHHFADASLKGYGQFSYLRLTNQVGKIYCSFVVGKARVAPLKIVTVPRLELTAAVVSVRVADLLRK